MKKPNKNLMKLYDIGTIQGINIKSRQTGTDTSRTYIKIFGTLSNIDGWLDIYEEYLDIQVLHNSIATIKNHYQKEIYEWFEFKKKYDLELSEYERLKAKFEK